MKLNTSASLSPIQSAGFIAANGPNLVGTGVSHLSATVSGPTVGAYATYFSEGFSTDVAVKFDFLTVNETFNDLLATTQSGNNPPLQHPLQHSSPFRVPGRSTC
jgi:hypothetical protein